MDDGLTTNHLAGSLATSITMYLTRSVAAGDKKFYTNVPILPVKVGHVIRLTIDYELSHEERLTARYLGVVGDEAEWEIV